MKWLQGVSIFEAALLYCGEGSTMPEGNSEGTGREDGGRQTVDPPSEQKTKSST